MKPKIGLKTPIGLITLSQVCKLLGVDRRTIKRWADGGYIQKNGTFKSYTNLPKFPPSVFICGQHFFQSDQIAEWQRKVFNHAA